jgi:hypothetical protein
MSCKSFYIKERDPWRLRHAGARSTLTLFRSGVHFGVRGYTLDDTIKEPESAFGQPNWWLLARARALNSLSQQPIRRHRLILRQQYT